MRVVVVVVVFFVWVILDNIRDHTASKFFIGLLLLLTTTSLYIRLQGFCYTIVSMPISSFESTMMLIETLLLAP